MNDKQRKEVGSILIAVKNENFTIEEGLGRIEVILEEV